MHPPDRTDGPAAEECTTITLFEDHGLGGGTTLISGTHYRLVDAGITEFEPIDGFFDSLESAFIRTYLASTAERGVPPHVAAAIEDARARTQEALADDPTADLRTDDITGFYWRTAGFHRRYR